MHAFGSRPRATALVPLTFTALLAVGLSACGSSGGDSSDPAPKPATQTSSPADHSISPPDMPVPPQVLHEQGAVADISWDASKCGTDQGVQKVSGTVKNPTKKPVDYVITINWTNATSDVLGRGIAVKRHVPAGRSTPWSLTAKVADGASACVPNVLRGKVVSKGAGGKKKGKG